MPFFRSALVPVLMGSLLLLALTLAVFAQSTSNTWIRHFGGPLSDTANMALPVPGGGFIVAGDTKSYGFGNSDAWIIRLDEKGNKVWDRQFGGSDSDSGSVARPMPGGDFILVGNTRSRGAGKSDAMIARMDRTGKTKWEFVYGRSKNDYLVSAINAPRGGLVAVGRTNSTSDGKNDAWVVAIDRNGEVLWERVIGSPDRDEMASSVVVAPGGGYVFVGYNETATGRTDVWVVKLSRRGNILWSKNFDYNGQSDRGNAIAPLADGGFVIAADTLMNAGQNFDPWVFTLDKNGNKGWSQKIGAAKMDTILSVVPTFDGGLVFAGATESFGKGKADAMFLRLTGQGKMQWVITYGGTGWDYATSIFPAPGGGFIAAGRTNSSGAGQDEAWIIRMNDKGRAQK